MGHKLATHSPPLEGNIYYLKQLQLCPRESNGVSEIANDEIHYARAEVALYAHSTIRDAIRFI